MMLSKKQLGNNTQQSAMKQAPRQKQQQQQQQQTPPRKSNNKTTSSASQQQQQHDNKDPVVASLPKRQNPYSAVSLAPNRKHAVTAGNDTLQIVSIDPLAGLEVIKTIPFGPVAQQAAGNVDAATTTAKTSNKTVFAPPPNKVLAPFSRMRMSENLFEPHHNKPSSPVNHAPTGMNVVTTDVAWSHPLLLLDNGPNVSGLSTQHPHSTATTTTTAGTATQQSQKQSQGHSFIAAGGSNGVVAIWETKQLLETKGHRPEIVLLQHSRAVSRLSWHPFRAMVLSASLDSSVRCWERRKVRSNKQNTTTDAAGKGTNKSQGFPFFGAPPQQQSGSTSTGNQDNYTWQCTGVFEPRTEAVRDVAWSPFLDDIFALTTSSGNLVVYNRFVRAKCMVKISAHNGLASSLSWHPTQRYTIATGGSNDRLVKVWNLQHALKLDIGMESGMIHMNQNTVSSRGAESIQSMESDVHTDSSGGSKAATNLNTFGSSSNANPLSRQPPTHVLAVAASVNRIKWRPPAFPASQTAAAATTTMTDNSLTTDSPMGSTRSLEETGRMAFSSLVAGNNQNNLNNSEAAASGDVNESFLVVATAPLKGETSGGAGVVALWSYHRPYMPLRVIEGHKEGAVVDFVWLNTPVSNSSTPGKSTYSPSRTRAGRSSSHHQIGDVAAQLDAPFATDNNRNPTERIKDGAIWQHVLSVGKDGRCLIQSLVRGDRPISRVPPSCFAMANLSPFQRGCGSLQIFSVSQSVPSSRQDFFLTALRQDRVTASAPGIFREEANSNGASDLRAKVTRQRVPEQRPTITFNEVDYGDLDEQGRPSSESDALVVAPEVVHVSRFAAMYVLHPSQSHDSSYPNRVSICMHNAEVAACLKVEHLAQMWRMIAIMLENAGIDSLADIENSNQSNPFNAIQFAIVPTIQSILEDCANDGDVQTCVAVCEVLQVLTSNDDESTRIPDLEIQLIREWYFSYIDLLRDMCLFSHANAVIRNCNDSVISGLNKKSTTISEACPQCGKPLLSEGGENFEEGLARRVCKSCQRRIGKCFVCHLPVKGMYVWCPGCGHGGHLEHALSWFGGMGGNAMREFCPTGCGHKCANVLQTCVTIPRTESMREVGD